MMPLLMLGIVTIAFLLSHMTQANPLSAILSERQMMKRGCGGGGEGALGAGSLAGRPVSRLCAEPAGRRHGNLVSHQSRRAARHRRSAAGDAGTGGRRDDHWHAGRHRLGRHRRRRARPHSGSPRAAARAGWVLDPGVLVRADLPVCLLGSTRLAARSRTAGFPRGPAADGDRLLHGGHAAGRRRRRLRLRRAPSDPARRWRWPGRRWASSRAWCAAACWKSWRWISSPWRGPRGPASGACC